MHRIGLFAVGGILADTRGDAGLLPLFAAALLGPAAFVVIPVTCSWCCPHG